MSVYRGILSEAQINTLTTYIKRFPVHTKDIAIPLVVRCMVKVMRNHGVLEVTPDVCDIRDDVAADQMYAVVLQLPQGDLYVGNAYASLTGLLICLKKVTIIPTIKVNDRVPVALWPELAVNAPIIDKMMLKFNSRFVGLSNIGKMLFLVHKYDGRVGMMFSSDPLQYIPVIEDDEHMAKFYGQHPAWVCRDNVYRLVMPLRFINDWNTLMAKRLPGTMYILIPISLVDNCDGKSKAHAAFLLADLKFKRLLIIEPHLTKDIGYYNMGVLRRDLTKFVKAYMSPHITKVALMARLLKTCKQGPQTAADAQHVVRGPDDPGGYCATWDIAVVDMYISNPRKVSNIIDKACQLAQTCNIILSRNLTVFLAKFMLQLFDKKHREVLLSDKPMTDDDAESIVKHLDNIISNAKTSYMGV